jgi:hydroxyacylglutathione hydrolase
MLSVKQIYTHSPLRNYTYLVYSDRSGEAICIDPFSAEEIIQTLKKNSLKLKTILNTHEHKDHVAGNLELKDATKARVLAHPDTLGKIPGLDDVIGEEDIVFSSENESLVALDTPGHTFCHLCFVWKNAKHAKGIFTGDTLFHAGVGNCYRGGDPKTLYHTLHEKILTLPQNIQLFPGHDYVENNLKFALELEPSNATLLELELWVKANHSEINPFQSDLAHEIEINPYFRLAQILKNSPDFFKGMDPSLPKTDQNLFLYLRSVRDKW